VRWYLIFPKVVGFAPCFIFYLFNEKLKTRVCHRLYISGKEFTLALFFFIFFVEINLTVRFKGFSGHNLVILFYVPINWFLSLSISPFNQPKRATNVTINCFDHWKKAVVPIEFVRRRLFVQHSSSFWVRSTDWKPTEVFDVGLPRPLSLNNWTTLPAFSECLSSLVSLISLVNEGMNKDTRWRWLNCW